MQILCFVPVTFNEPVFFNLLETNLFVHNSCFCVFCYSIALYKNSFATVSESFVVVVVVVLHFTESVLLLAKFT